MSGKKARETRRDERNLLQVNIFGLVEWNMSTAGECDACHQVVDMRARLTAYDLYSTDPSVRSMAGTLAGELQVDEHMQRVMKAQAAGRFKVSATRLLCWTHAEEAIAQFLNDNNLALLSSIPAMVSGKPMFTALVVYSEPGAWGRTTPSVANGYGKPNLPTIFNKVRQRKPKQKGDDGPGLYIMEVDD